MNLRQLVYRFLELPHVTRVEIAQSLNLTRKSDSKLSDHAVYSKWLVRASKAKQLAKLWEQVNEHHEL